MAWSTRRGAILLTTLVCGVALAAPSPAFAGSNPPLSMEKARHTSAVYAQELCAADDSCTEVTIGKCTRLGPKRVRCKARFDRKNNDDCTAKFVIKKAHGEVKGKVKDLTCD